jgi:hypothetical protein
LADTTKHWNTMKQMVKYYEIPWIRKKLES